MVMAQEDTETETVEPNDIPTSPEESQETKAKTTPEVKKETPPEEEEESTQDWGTFYDPQDVFCGEHDSYKILGSDYNDTPDSKQITRSFRILNRKWHPDKNKQKGAKELFVVRFFEILYKN